MKENRVSPLNETGEGNTIEGTEKDEIQHERRKQIECIYKRHNQVQECKSILQENSGETHNEKSTKKMLTDMSAACNPLNIAQCPHFLSKKVKILINVMEKLGFFCATASFHYFYYSVILLLSVVLLITGQNIRDALLMSRLFKEGFPMIIVLTSFIQTFVCFIAAVTGFCVVRKKTFCALTIYFVLVILSIGAIASYMTTRYYYSQEKVVKRQVRAYMAASKYNKNSSREISKFMSVVQKKLDCCGSKGPSDYAVNDKDEIIYLPLSCCSHAYSTMKKEDKRICYLIKNDDKLKTRRDILMRKIVNSKGCSARIAKLLSYRNEFELILTILLLVVFILVIVCTLYFWKHLRIVLNEQDIRKKLNQPEHAKKFWGHIRSRLLGEESMNTTALNQLRKGIHECNNKEEIREFLLKCTDAKDLLTQKNPMELAEDIITNNAIPGLPTSLTNVHITKSEEYEAKLAGSFCASVTGQQVKGNQDKALEKCRANVQTRLHEDYWIEEKGAKRRKVSKVSSAIDNKESLGSAAAAPAAINEKLPEAPFPSPLSSTHQHQPVHRKSLIQLQLQKHLVKEQQLILAKLVGEYQDEQLQMENRKVKYALSHKDVPIDEIAKLNLEITTNSPHKTYSVEEVYLNRKATRTLLGPSNYGTVADIDYKNEETSTLFPNVDKKESQCEIAIPLKRGETFTRIPVQKPIVEKKEIGTLVHAADLREMEPFGTQTVTVKPPKEKK